MDTKKLITIVSIVSMLAVPAATAGGSVAPMNPVMNPGFELYFPTALYQPLEDTPVDECIGIGHQVFYGTDSPQHHAVNTVQEDEDGNIIVSTENANAAADEASDPEEIEEQSGYGHCEFSQQEGYDIAWLNPVGLVSDPAIHWSNLNAEFGDFDADGDREAKIPYNEGPNHNLWQSWASPFQAFTGDFQALELDVEEGEIPDSASIKVSLSATPLNRQNHEVVLFLDCSLNFDGSLLNANAEKVDADLPFLPPVDRISVDPVNATFSDRGDEDCQGLKESWDSGDEEAKRDVLGQLRIVQLSFWGFHNAPEGATADGVVIDNVSLTGSKSVAEAAPGAQVNPDV